jgi:hypothetical protein
MVESFTMKAITVYFCFAVFAFVAGQTQKPGFEPNSTPQSIDEEGDFTKDFTKDPRLKAIQTKDIPRSFEFTGIPDKGTFIQREEAPTGRKEPSFKSL